MHCIVLELLTQQGQANNRIAYSKNWPRHIRNERGLTGSRQSNPFTLHNIIRSCCMYRRGPLSSLTLSWKNYSISQEHPPHLVKELTANVKTEDSWLVFVYSHIFMIISYMFEMMRKFWNFHLNLMSHSFILFFFRDS